MTIKKQVQVSYILELEYNPDSEQFQTALKDYNEAICSNTSEDQLIQFVAKHIMKYGIGPMMPGVGYIKYNGRCTDERLWSGVSVIDDEPSAETELL